MNDRGRHKARPTGRQETYLDGLSEVAAGVVLFVVALATGRPAFYWTYLAAIVVLGRGMRHLKARYTYPRIGYARYPDEDPHRFRWGVASWVLGVFVVAAATLTATGHVTDNLAWRRAAPALAGALLSGGFLYIARQSGRPRHYLLAAASVLLGVLLTWPRLDGAYANLRVWAIAMALLCLAIGGEVLRRFLRDYPIVEDRMPDAR